MIQGTESAKPSRCTPSRALVWYVHCLVASKTSTLQWTSKSPTNALLNMTFPFPNWHMLDFWRMHYFGMCWFTCASWFFHTSRTLERVNSTWMTNLQHSVAVTAIQRFTEKNVISSQVHVQLCYWLPDQSGISPNSLTTLLTFLNRMDDCLTFWGTWNILLGSMYVWYIYLPTHIPEKNHPNVGQYTHNYIWSHGIGWWFSKWRVFLCPGSTENSLPTTRKLWGCFQTLTK